MDLNQIITAVMLVFLVLGAADYALENKFGLGREFEEGILACGRLILCMAGFMVLAPLIAQVMGSVISPFFRALGIDPSILAGMLLANDSGGFALAMELADDPQAGQYSGLVVGAMLGTTVMLGIPTSMTFATKEERPAVIYGILCGIITIPLGCLAGGLVAGFSPKLVLMNTLPVLLLSVVLLVLLLTLGEKIVPVFSVFGKCLVGVSMFGLACGAAEALIGFTVFEGMTPLAEVFPIVGSIAIFLGGAFPFLAVVRRVFSAFFAKMGRLLGVNDVSVSGLVLALANPMPPFMMMHDMDDRGRLLNIAFLTSAGCVLGDHLAYTSQVAPQLSVPVLIGKFVGGATALAAALFLTRRRGNLSANFKKPENTLSKP